MVMVAMVKKKKYIYVKYTIKAMVLVPKSWLCPCMSTPEPGTHPLTLTVETGKLMLINGFHAHEFAKYQYGCGLVLAYIARP